MKVLLDIGAAARPASHPSRLAIGAAPDPGRDDGRDREPGGARPWSLCP
jgi:hypothetical protein